MSNCLEISPVSFICMPRTNQFFVPRYLPSFAQESQPFLLLYVRYFTEPVRPSFASLTLIYCRLLFLDPAVAPFVFQVFVQDLLALALYLTCGFATFSFTGFAAGWEASTVVAVVSLEESLESAELSPAAYAQAGASAQSKTTPNSMTSGRIARFTVDIGAPFPRRLCCQL